MHQSKMEGSGGKTEAAKATLSRFSHRRRRNSRSTRRPWWDCNCRRIPRRGEPSKLFSSVASEEGSQKTQAWCSLRATWMGIIRRGREEKISGSFFPILGHILCQSLCFRLRDVRVQMASWKHVLFGQFSSLGNRYFLYEVIGLFWDIDMYNRLTCPKFQNTHHVTQKHSLL